MTIANKGPRTVIPPDWSFALRFRAVLLSVSLTLTGCATTRVSPVFSFSGPLETPSGPSISEMTQIGRARVETFFSLPFAAPLEIVVAPNRTAFDALFADDPDIAPTQCWMVGVGGASLLALLSPRAWPSEACEHEANDAAHVQEIVTHELTHAFHGQRNPTGDFKGMDDVGWFVEGLAVVVSGQLERGNRPSATDALAAGAAPARLADAWSGRYRYGVSGSMVAWIDAVYGRTTVKELLEAVTQQEILEELGLTENEFLTRWRAWVTKPL